MTLKFRTFVCFVALALLVFSAAQTRAATGGASMLPSGYLSTNGNQIVDASGNPVRLACVGLFDWSSEGSTTIAGDFSGIAAAGFNCVRYPWYDQTLTNDLATIDQMVTAANQYGLKIILDHHANEATVNANGTDNGPAYPCNGLWYDAGGTNPVPGCPAGNYTSAQVVANWQTVAQHYAGNSTVIGFDLQNEPHLSPSYWSVGPGGSTWGNGGATDIRLYYSNAAGAIQVVNPGVLIICEGVGNATSNLLNGQAPIGGGWDLTLAASNPVTSQIAHKLVYSEHNYPAAIAGTTPSIQAMNQTWGFLVSQNLYPVFVGELGGSFDGTNDSAGANLADEQAWASTLVAYLNGEDGAQGGPTFSGNQQGVSTDWWAWGYLRGESPDGTLTSASQTSLNPSQYAIYSRLQFHPAAPVVATAAPKSCVASANGSTITSVGPTLCDSSGNTWALTSAGTITVNGVAAGYSSGVIELALVGGSIWQENSAQLWWQYVNGGWSSGPGTSISPLRTAAAVTSMGTLCATEGATCSFSGAHFVTFGAGTSFITLTETNSVPCSTAIFTDPASGILKACYVSAQSPTVMAGSTGALCATEGVACSFPGTQLITFGAGTLYNQRAATNGILCSNQTFNDPNPGVRKACYDGPVP